MVMARVAGRPGGAVAGLLLAALLGVLGLAGVLPGGGGAVQFSGPAVDGAQVNAVAPVRGVGRPVAEPSPVIVHVPIELVGDLPGVGAPLVLARVAGQDAGIVLARRAVARVSLGGRAPPFRLSDL